MNVNRRTVPEQEMLRSEFFRKLFFFNNPLFGVDHTYDRVLTATLWQNVVVRNILSDLFLLVQSSFFTCFAS